MWLKAALAKSDAPFKVVFMHHPPYSSGQHVDSIRMQWPYAEWGADLVLAGHDHTYERLELGGIIFCVNGLGGNETLYKFKQAREGSMLRYNGDLGAMRCKADHRCLEVEFWTVTGLLVDSFELQAKRLQLPKECK